LTYLVAGIAATGMQGREIVCSSSEANIFQPPAGSTCGDYMSAYLATSPGGTLYNPAATSDCQYCALSTAEQFLASDQIFYSQRWRNYGIGWAYIVFNIFGATVLYYGFRVKHWNLASLATPFTTAGGWFSSLLHQGRPENKNKAKNDRIY
jgi:ATP-binding cassette subfamily G (WHITE) protein 2 (PDR)